MSNHNYTKYSNKKFDNEVKEPKQPEIVVEQFSVESEVEINEIPDVTTTNAPEVALVEETVETVTLPETVTGVVANCTKLNVRVAPVAGAEVTCVLDAKTEVEINLANSTDEWFSICTAAGVDGYCMRKFVEASL